MQSSEQLIKPICLLPLLYIKKTYPYSSRYILSVSFDVLLQCIDQPQKARLVKSPWPSMTQQCSRSIVEISVWQLHAQATVGPRWHLRCCFLAWLQSWKKENKESHIDGSVFLRLHSTTQTLTKHLYLPLWALHHYTTTPQMPITVWSAKTESASDHQSLQIYTDWHILGRWKWRPYNLMPTDSPMPTVHTNWIPTEHRLVYLGLPTDSSLRTYSNQWFVDINWVLATDVGR